MKSYEKTEVYDNDLIASMSENYKTIIENLGEDVNREGLQKTPERVAKAMHDGGRIGQILHSLPLSKQLADALGIESPNEGWIIGVKIMSDEVWKSIKDGKLKAFSVGGWARMQDA